LSERIVTPSTRFTLPYQLHVADRIIHDAEERGTVNYSVAQILAHSSNIGAITLAQMLGKTRLSSWITRFGFGRTTGVDFPARAPASSCRRTSGRGRRSGTSRSDRHRGHPGADGRRVCGDRQPRHLVASSHRRPRRGRWATLTSPPPAGLASDCASADGHAQGRRRGGDGDLRRHSRLPGGREDRDCAEAGFARRVTPTGRYVASFVGAVPALVPASSFSSPSTSRAVRSGAAWSRRRRSSRSPASTSSTSRFLRTRLIRTSGRRRPSHYT
jgi:hypothetical protein